MDINSCSYTSAGFLGTNYLEKIEDYEHLLFLSVYKDTKYRVDYEDYDGFVREEYYEFDTEAEAIAKYHELLNRKTAEIDKLNNKLRELIERRDAI